MLTPDLLLVATTWMSAAILMAILWAWHLRIRNAAIVDVGWAGGLALAAVFALLFGIGDPMRRGVAGLLMLGWGARLALHLYQDRVRGHAEDPRYATLRAARGSAANRWFFWFFQAQAVLVALLSWPVMLSASDVRPPESPLFWLGIVLGLVSIVGESVADAQLRDFKRSAAHRGQVCRVGLWQYSRHPNYFFEWLVWVAYALLATDSPSGWLAWACPAVMLYFLFRVTGIPATEAQALRSRGDAYAEYQRTTSAFVPWWPRTAPHGSRAHDLVTHNRVS